MLERLPAGGSCAQIGTWRGDFAALILEHRKPEKLYLIDPWAQGREPDPQGPGAGEGKPEHQAVEDLFQSVLGRFELQIDDGRVVVMRQRPTDAALTFAPDSLDWVHIAGEQSYDGVVADLNAYFAVVKPGGYLAGEHYGEGASAFGEGVRQAVEQFLPRCSGFELIGTQFLLRKPE